MLAYNLRTAFSLFFFFLTIRMTNYCQETSFRNINISVIIEGFFTLHYQNPSSSWGNTNSVLLPCIQNRILLKATAGCKLTQKSSTLHASSLFFYLFRLIDWVSVQYQISSSSLRGSFSNTGIEPSLNHLSAFLKGDAMRNTLCLWFIDYTQSSQ